MVTKDTVKETITALPYNDERDAFEALSSYCFQLEERIALLEEQMKHTHGMFPIEIDPQQPDPNNFDDYDDERELAAPTTAKAETGTDTTDWLPQPEPGTVVKGVYIKDGEVTLVTAPQPPTAPASKVRRAQRSKMVRCGDLKVGDEILYPGRKNEYFKILEVLKRPGVAEIKIEYRKMPFLFAADATIRTRQALNGR